MKRHSLRLAGTILLSAGLIFAGACTTTAVEAPPPAPEVFKGIASWYGDKPTGGMNTASGERYKPEELTAAHRTFKFGTRVKVTNTRNDKSVIVRINDRGPFVKGRIIDLSKAAAEKIQMTRAGLVPVTVEVVTAE